MSRIRVVFCGTPRFAVPSLKHLLEQKDFEIVGVFTQPDRPRGRGQEISYSPVKELALAENIPVFQPAKVRAPEVEEQLRKLAPEVIVIIAYGQIIPARLLGIPKYGWINLHASLLPKYRGAAPINWAIVNGEARTGLTTMRIDAGMDTGEMLLQEELAIGADETAPELMVRLADEDIAWVGGGNDEGARPESCGGHAGAAVEARGRADRVDASGGGNLQPDAGIRAVAWGVYGISRADEPPVG